ncbi:S8 family serine peptidase [Streptomyces albidoflavus]|uniref:S8 family serine peptidase n=1 Tax=Streptomyces albidoflavus TaxID=1886 RepID=UPI001020E56C|nr:S8 family serine peptidase [Streptomyces albidoflavus]RZF06090.1 serine protease [Streptomyces albidoflavus]
MTSESPQAPISGDRRAARVAVAAGLVAALCAGAPLPMAFAADEPATAPTVKSAADKLGSADAERLAEAKADGDKHVTMMIATQPGRTAEVAGKLKAVKGGSVGKTHDKLGYVRATVPTGQADAAIKAAAKLSAVHGIDLNQEIQLDDPTPSGDRAKGVKSAATDSDDFYGAPNAKTPAKNPFNPSFETGAVEFVEKNPKADGRGITIGILDSGIDLGHPALQKTTTGERKITDWVTATDPIVDGDQTWRPMVDAVSGPSFTYKGRTYKAPAGSYQVSVFAEAASKGGDADGDLNRDGDTTDTWGVLYDAKNGTVRVDLNDNGDFTDDEVLRPYKDKFQVGYFGKDDPKTDVVEQIPFVVELRKGVPMDPYGGSWVGKKADFVNIGIIEGSHGTHVAGITAANSLFGGKMNGAAPGAKLVSSRACTWSGGCTSVALTEGMIDLAANRGVDIINMSIGGLPALNDGNNARAELYTRIIDAFGVQLVISAGNSGPGANTIGDPSLADKVISVGATISKETWLANYGSEVRKPYAMMPFSSRGPREDGGFTPTLSAPGAAINTTQTWFPGGPTLEAGYDLPAGYSMLQGTSMASPQAAGASALLLSKAKQQGIDLTPAKLRSALTSTATQIDGVQAYEQGAGLINIVDAWKQINKQDGDTHEYTVRAPVDTAIDELLKDPGHGTGVYDREGGLKVGKKRLYDITVTRTTGPKKAVSHKLALVNNHDETFKLVGGKKVDLKLNKPVTLTVSAKAATKGLHSAILTVDDPSTQGTDQQIMTTVVAADELAKPSFTVKKSGEVDRNETRSYFVEVPEGAKSLEVSLGGLFGKSQVRFISIHPYGVPVDSTSTPNCYNNYNNGNGCRPDLRSYADPAPGVWEIEVEARRTSPLLRNPYQLEVSLLGVAFDPAVQTVPEAKVGTPAPVEWKITNENAALEGKLKGGPLGSSLSKRPEIKNGEAQTSEITVGEGVERLDVAIGNVSDVAADLDLTLYDEQGNQVAQTADGDSEEALSVAKPKPGTYTVEVYAYSVPSGSTAYDYRDVYFSAALGEVKVDTAKTVKLATGASAKIAAEVLVAAPAPEGRKFFGQVQVLNAKGTAAGSGSVEIGKVTE